MIRDRKWTFCLAFLSFAAVQHHAAAEQSSAIPPAAWALAEQQADRFEDAFRTGGMAGVASDIEQCYDMAMQSGQQIVIRDCLVYDDFADKFAALLNRQNHLPIPPYFQAAEIYPRWSKYSGPAGFTDAQVMSGYLAEGSNLIYAVISARAKEAH